MRTLTSVPLVAFLIAAASAEAHGPVCRELAPERLEIVALDRLHSTLSKALGYRLGFVPFLADDVVVIVSGQPILHGKAAASDYYASQGAGDRLSWTPTRIDASVDGAMGTSWGWTTTIRTAADGTTTTALGKNIAVWKRTCNGWRVAAYLQTPSAPPQPTPAGFGLFPDETRRCVTIGDPAAETAAVESTDSDFAAYSVAHGFGIAFATFAAPDAALRFGGQLFIGPDEIHDVFGDPSPSEDLLDWGPSFGAAARSGDLGWTAGDATETLFDPAGNEVFTDSYLTLWKKQPDGSWRYVTDGAN